MTGKIGGPAVGVPAARTDTSQNSQRPNLIGALEVPRRVDLGASTRGRERRSAQLAEHPVHLPPARDRTRNPALGPLLLLAERQFVRAVKREIVWAVISRQRLISIAICRIRPEQEAALAAKYR